jgi:hypothetical protein
VTTGIPVWLNGPYPGSIHDIQCCRMDGILKKLERKEFIFGDQGYAGEQKIITPWKVQGMETNQINRRKHNRENQILSMSESSVETRHCTTPYSLHSCNSNNSFGNDTGFCGFSSLTQLINLSFPFVFVSEDKTKKLDEINVLKIQEVETSF